MEAGQGAIATSGTHSKEISMLPGSSIVDLTDFAASPDFTFPIGNSSSEPVDKSSGAATAPNHYAVVILDAVGLELRGWDFKTLEEAKAFGNQLCLKGLRVQVWARDDYGKRLAPIHAMPAQRLRPLGVRAECLSPCSRLWTKSVVDVRVRANLQIVEGCAGRQ
jgi:hypothetical protein